MSADRSKHADLQFRALVWALIAAIAAAVGIGVWMAAFDVSNRDSERLLTLAIMIPLFVGAMLAAVAVIRRRPMLTPLMMASVLAILAGAIALLQQVYLRQVDYEWKLGQIGLMCLFIGFALGHSGVFAVMIQSRTRLLLVAKIAVMISAWLFALCFAMFMLVLMLETSGNMGLVFFFLPLLATFGVATAFGTVAVPIAAHSQANKRGLPAESVQSKVSVRLGCPKCNYRQLFQAGHCRCEQCGVGFVIEVEEPRCECGYLLYQLQGNVCPECGREVPVQQRWNKPPVV